MNKAATNRSDVKAPSRGMGGWIPATELAEGRLTHSVYTNVIHEERALSQAWRTDVRRVRNDTQL